MKEILDYGCRYFGWQEEMKAIKSCISCRLYRKDTNLSQKLREIVELKLGPQADGLSTLARLTFAAPDSATNIHPKDS